MINFRLNDGDTKTLTMIKGKITTQSRIKMKELQYLEIQSTHILLYTLLLINTYKEQ